MADLTFTNQNAQLVLEAKPPTEITISIAPAIIVDGGDSGSITTFTWTQSVASSVWTIPHNLNKFPSVTVVDTLNKTVYSDVSYIDSNIVQITNGSAFAGKAYLN